MNDTPLTDVTTADTPLTAMNFPAAEVTTSPPSVPAASLPGYRRPYLLEWSAFPVELRAAFEDVKRFWTSPKELRRKDPCILLQTYQKHQERNMGYVSWLLRSGHPHGVSLRDFLNVPLFTSFINDYLADGRQLSHASLALHIGSALIVAKYLIDTLGDREAEVALALLRRFRNHFVRQAEKTRLNKRNLNPTPTIDWVAFLEGVSTMMEHYETLAIEKDVTQGRALHDLLLLLYQAVLCPGRGTNIRFLQYVTEKPTAASPPGNYLWYDAKEGVYRITFMVFKNVASLGYQEVALPKDTETLPVNRLTRQYVENDLVPLRRRYNHNFFFMGNSGKEFKTASASTDYMKNLLSIWLGEEGSTTALRHALVRHLLTDSGATPALCSSVAAAMHHSPAQQQRYFDADSVSKKRAAVDYASRQLETILMAKKASTDGEPSSSCADSFAPDNAIPTPGTVVAACDLNNRSKPIFFGLVTGCARKGDEVDIIGKWLTVTSRKYARYKISSEDMNEPLAALTHPIKFDIHESGEYIVKTSVAVVRDLYVGNKVH